MTSPPVGKEIRVLTWNTNRRSPSILGRLGDRLDIVTLQEVTYKQRDAFRDRLAEMGLPYRVYTGKPNARNKRYGNMIASRWPVKRIPIPERLRRKIRWPELIAHAVIDVEGRQAHVITAHIPNGERNGWVKIDTFRVLKRIVQGVQGRPCILTGDFNEPRYRIQDHGIVTFGHYWDRATRRYALWRKWTFKGCSGTGQEWDDAVQWFFERHHDHGLQHAYWAACGKRKTAVTHRSHGCPRWFDHVFVSDHFDVRLCKYLHGVRLTGLSDHSALLTHLTVRDKDALPRTRARVTRTGQ